MKIAVTGAGGYVGRHCVQALIQAGHTVRALSGQATAPAALQLLPQQREQLQWQRLAWQGDGQAVEQMEAAARWFDGCDAVIHAAARVHESGDATHNDSAFQRDNVQLTDRMARAAMAAGVGRFVLLSSIAVHGCNERTALLNNAARVQPATAYARSKLDAERALQALCAQPDGGCMRGVILRPPVVYGVGCPGNMDRLARAIAGGWPLPLGAARQNRRSLIHVEALAQACLWAATESIPAEAQIILPCDEVPVSTAAMVRALAAGMKRSPRLIAVPETLMRGVLICAGQRRMAAQLFGSLEIDGSAQRAAGLVLTTDTLTALQRMGAAYNRVL